MTAFDDKIATGPVYTKQGKGSTHLRSRWQPHHEKHVPTNTIPAWKHTHTHNTSTPIRPPQWLLYWPQGHRQAPKRGTPWQQQQQPPRSISK